jgi:hypothetical protein
MYLSNCEFECAHDNNSVWKAIVRALPRRRPFDLPEMIKENRRCVMLGNRGLGARGKRSGLQWRQ